MIIWQGLCMTETVTWNAGGEAQQYGLLTPLVPTMEAGATILEVAAGMCPNGTVVGIFVDSAQSWDMVITGPDGRHTTMNLGLLASTGNRRGLNAIKAAILLAVQDVGAA
jgi:hypothetical protein